MGKKTVKFKCHSCGHCCTEVVCTPTPWDVKRIIEEVGADPDDFLEFLGPDELEGVEKDDPTWIEVDDERYIMALKRGKKGCHFLDKKTGFCSIYESRPILCRLYPFKLQETRDGDFKGFMLHEDVGCPKHRDGEVATEPLYDLYVEDDDYQDDYSDLADIFNRKDYDNKEAEDFVVMFMEGVYVQEIPFSTESK